VVTQKRKDNIEKFKLTTTNKTRDKKEKMATSAATASSTISTYNNKFWELMDKMSRREIGHKTVDREVSFYQIYKEKR